MTAPNGVQQLQSLYANWIGELLGGVIPHENRATCDNCAMCAHKDQGLPSVKSIFFDPDVKCCSYVPDLANFLVGRILLDSKDPAKQVGRATLIKRIADGVGVTPLGLQQSPVFALLYENSSVMFGRSKALRCPHYLEDSGRCGIWQNRNSACITWFCKHVRGQVGATFWARLRRTLEEVESKLSLWCALELQLGDEAIRCLADLKREGEPITHETLDNKVNEKRYARIWGDWYRREHEFFESCAHLIDPLSWADVSAICGPELRMYGRLTQEAYAQLVSNETPSTLKIGSMQLMHKDRTMTRVSTYRSSDPLDVPNSVMELLQYFDGRPTEETIADIVEERGIRLEPDLVRKLADFMLLVSPDDEQKYSS